MQPVNREFRKHGRFSVFSYFTVFCAGTAFVHIHVPMCVISKTNTENVVIHGLSSNWLIYFTVRPTDVPAAVT